MVFNMHFYVLVFIYGFSICFVLFFRVHIVRNASPCLWVLQKAEALAVRVGSFAKETVMCVCHGTKT